MSTTHVHSAEREIARANLDAEYESVDYITFTAHRTAHLDEHLTQVTGTADSDVVIARIHDPVDGFQKATVDLDRHAVVKLMEALEQVRDYLDGVTAAEREVIVMQVQAPEGEEEVTDDEGHWWHDGEYVLVCPHGCGETSVEEVDRSERSNSTELVVPEDGSDPYLSVVQGDGDYHTVRWECEGCSREVILPEWLETHWG